MRAITQTRYGTPDVLTLSEVPTPEPGPGEVRVRVHAASVHADVWHVVAGQPRVLRIMGAGLRRPRQPIPGTDMAGVVDAVGPGVEAWAAGDAVFGETVAGFPWKNGGAFADFVVVPAGELARKPDAVSFEQAATVPTSGLIALRTLLDEGDLTRARRVLINGAAGALGSLALPLARAHGAEVTAVDRAEKLPLLRALGADHVIDYQSQPLSLHGTEYDLIYDVASTLSLRDCEPLFSPEGRLVVIGHDAYRPSLLGSLPRMIGLTLRSLFTRRLLTPGRASLSRPDALEHLRAALADGTLAPHIAHTFPLEETADALRLLMSGEVAGKIVLKVSD